MSPTDSFTKRELIECARAVTEKVGLITLTSFLYCSDRTTFTETFIFYIKCSKSQREREIRSALWACILLCLVCCIRGKRASVQCCHSSFIRLNRVRVEHWMYIWVLLKKTKIQWDEEFQVEEASNSCSMGFDVRILLCCKSHCCRGELISLHLGLLAANFATLKGLTLMVVATKHLAKFFSHCAGSISLMYFRVSNQSFYVFIWLPKALIYEMFQLFGPPINKNEEASPLWTFYALSAWKCHNMESAVEVFLCSEFVLLCERWP